jgi:hypothetical protein
MVSGQQVIAELQEHGGKMDQDQLVQEFHHQATEGEVLQTMRGMFREGTLSYSLDWDIMLEEY